MKKSVEDIIKELMGITTANNAPPKPTILKPTINTPSYRKIWEVIDRGYDFQLMKKFQKTYLIPFFKQHEHLFIDAKYDFFVQNIEHKTPTKQILAQTFAYLYVEKDVFLAFVQWMPTHFRKAIEIIIEKGEIQVSELKEHCDYDPIVPLGNNYGYYGNADKKEVQEDICCVFSHRGYVKNNNYAYNIQKNTPYIARYTHVFFYPTEILQVLRDYYPRPQSANIEATTLPENVSVFQGEENLFTLLNYAITYLEQGKLELTKTGKVSIPQVGKMQKFLSLPEFFTASGDKEVDNLRSCIWVNWLSPYCLAAQESKQFDKNILTLSHIDLLKKLLKGYTESIIKSNDFLLHLNGTPNGMNPKYQESIWSFLKQLKQGEWVNTQRILSSAEYDEALPVPINIYDAQYFYAKTSNGRLDVNSGNYKVLIAKPMFNANLFMLASMGLLDMAYTSPPKNEWAIDNGLPTPFVSPLDGLVAVRLTALGAYLMGKTNEYVIEEPQEENVQLDENTLYIFYNGTNNALRSVIEQTARPAGTSLYKVDYETVLGDCANHKQVQSKINIFKKLLSNNPPKIWKDFFESLQEKSYQLKDENDTFRVFRLPQNPELVNLIAREASLKKYILKAEGYMVLIRRQDVSAVKKQLKNYGFLVDFLTNDV